MANPSPLSNSANLRADSFEVWNPRKRKYEPVGASIVGLAPDDLNTIELVAQAIDNDPNYFQNIAAGLSAKADRSDVDAELSLLAGLVNTKASASDTAASLALKADQSGLDALGATVATKASQAQLDFVGQNFQPRITAFEPLALVPRTDPNDNPFSELSIDLDAYATTAALALKAGAADTAAALALKASAADTTAALALKADKSDLDTLRDGHLERSGHHSGPRA
jgi:hypothetical protein